LYIKISNNYNIMKKSKEFNRFHNKIIEHFDNINITIEEYKKKIKKEYQLLHLQRINDLITTIAEGEEIDVDYLKNKYLKEKEIIINEEIINTVTEETEELLDKIIIENETYYYENKEKGKVYNTSNIEVGIYKNGSIIFN